MPGADDQQHRRRLDHLDQHVDVRRRVPVAGLLAVRSQSQQARLVQPQLCQAGLAHPPLQLTAAERPHGRAVEPYQQLGAGRRLDAGRRTDNRGGHHRLAAVERGEHGTSNGGDC